jgi:glycosyltransferase involved in cell wall biosynthesis
MQNITIGIPAYNAHKTITDTLTSIVELNNSRELQIIVVDDCGSTDYNNILSQFDGMLDIKIIRLSSNQGPGIARNTILDHCTTEFISFIDADDIFITKDFLTRGVAALTANPQSPFYMSTFLYESKNGAATPTLELDWLHGKIYRVAVINQHNMRFTNSYFMEDLEFNLKLLMLCNNDPIYSDSVDYRYCTNPDSLLSSFESYAKLFIRSIRVGVDIRIKILSQPELLQHKVKEYIEKDILNYYSLANTIYDLFTDNTNIMIDFLFNQLNRYYTHIVSQYDINISQRPVQQPHLDFTTFYNRMVAAE